MNKWKLWGNWNNCLLFGSLFTNWVNSSIVKELNLNVNASMKILNGHFYVLENDLKILKELGVKGIEQDKKYFNQMFSICDKKTKEFLKLEGKKNLREFIVEITNFAGHTVVIELTALVLDTYFSDFSKKIGSSYAEFSSLVKPAKQSELMKYFEALKKQKNVNKIVKEFSWVGTHGLEGNSLTKEKALKEAKKFENIIEKAKNTPKEFEPIYDIVSKLIYQRSNIMETMDKVAFSYKNELIELGKKHNLSYNEILSFTWYELLELIDDKKIPDNIKTRTKDYGIIQITDNYNLIFGEELEKEFLLHQEKVDKNITELKGMIACPGYAKGKVKILKDYKDIPKVKEGDIIIASETTVDYVPAMAKAAAFVTDQGGITSHASVISREMNKPCIISTKFATEIFKDNDIVEVDANKGIVRLN